MTIVAPVAHVYEFDFGPNIWRCILHADDECDAASIIDEGMPS